MLIPVSNLKPEDSSFMLINYQKKELLIFFSWSVNQSAAAY